MKRSKSELRQQVFIYYLLFCRGVDTGLLLEVYILAPRHPAGGGVWPEEDRKRAGRGPEEGRKEEKEGRFFFVGGGPAATQLHTPPFLTPSLPHSLHCTDLLHLSAGAPLTPH